MTDEVAKDFGNKLKEIDDDLFLEFAHSDDKDKWLNDNAERLEGYDLFTKKYDNFYDFIGDKNKALEKLYWDMDGKMPSKARIFSFTKKYPEISEEEIKNWFENTNKYKEEYENERKIEKEKADRAKEMKDLPWYKDMLVSDYSKKRYIDDPSTSILGGKEYSALSTEGQKEMRDAIIGATAGVVDFFPGRIGVIAGPAVRALRDVAHRDEKYRPEGNMIKNIAADVGVNSVVEYLPTALIRKVGKIERGIGKSSPFLSNILRARDADIGMRAVNTAIDAVKGFKDKGDKRSLLNFIYSIPENNEFRNNVLRSVELEGKNVDDAIEFWTKRYRNMQGGALKEMRESTVNTGRINKNWTPLEKDVAVRPKLSKLQNVLKGGIDVAEAVLPGGIKAATRPDKDIQIEDKEFNDSVDRIINNYSMLWKVDKTPMGYDSPLIKAAYDKWRDSVTGTEKWKNRLGGSK